MKKASFKKNFVSVCVKILFPIVHFFEVITGRNTLILLLVHLHLCTTKSNTGTFLNYSEVCMSFLYNINLRDVQRKNGANKLAY